MSISLWYTGILIFNSRPVYRYRWYTAGNPSAAYLSAVVRPAAELHLTLLHPEPRHSD